MTDTPDLTLHVTEYACSGCGADLMVDDHFDGCPMNVLEPCDGCGSTTLDHEDNCPADPAQVDDGIQVEDPPDLPVTEQDGSWIWVPNGDLPDLDEARGMSAHTVTTRCRWSWREDHPAEPQDCCYSVLTTISRIPGPAQPDRTWLAHTPHLTAVSQVVTEGTQP